MPQLTHSSNHTSNARRSGPYNGLGRTDRDSWYSDIYHCDIQIDFCIPVAVLSISSIAQGTVTVTVIEFVVAAGWAFMSEVGTSLSSARIIFLWQFHSRGPVDSRVRHLSLLFALGACSLPALFSVG
jgi:hypothetical protein